MESQVKTQISGSLSKYAVKLLTTNEDLIELSQQTLRIFSNIKQNLLILKANPPLLSELSHKLIEERLNSIKKLIEKLNSKAKVLFQTTDMS